jgi:hypothetical protein
MLITLLKLQPLFPLPFQVPVVGTESTMCAKYVEKDVHILHSG